MMDGIQKVTRRVLNCCVVTSKRRDKRIKKGNVAALKGKIKKEL